MIYGHDFFSYSYHLCLPLRRRGYPFTADQSFSPSEPGSTSQHPVVPVPCSPAPPGLTRIQGECFFLSNRGGCSVETSTEGIHDPPKFKCFTGRSPFSRLLLVEQHYADMPVYFRRLFHPPCHSPHLVTLISPVSMRDPKASTFSLSISADGLQIPTKGCHEPRKDRYPAGRPPSFTPIHA